LTYLKKFIGFKRKAEKNKTINNRRQFFFEDLEKIREEKKPMMNPSSKTKFSLKNKIGNQTCFDPLLELAMRFIDYID